MVLSVSLMIIRINDMRTYSKRNERITIIYDIGMRSNVSKEKERIELISRLSGKQIF